MNKLGLACALSGLLAVSFGAFGAHALRDKLSAVDLAIYQTAVQYQFWHTLAALVAVFFLTQRKSAPDWQRAAVCFLLGIAIFSGSLYTLVLSGQRWLGMVTPFGGMTFIVGWIFMAKGFWHWEKS